ncbi:cobaltochelatase subunit CobN [Thiomicrorhabdus sp. 6S2-11]|uniref:Cobaltochelatase subunit CobN n=1 Tax=Thiomicrorhabdus marina TaxID=2818442 RepID=A0ABS3Q4R8_9GAMM|nr:cobaltochelatase subunit CobN [Thiomicrorhabdus marina]MBO1927330.1 cobaltochelatase subunit CobN [Thiomicrorhabdus marina]
MKHLVKWVFLMIGCLSFLTAPVFSSEAAAKSAENTTTKVALISTDFVLSKKFKIMTEAAKKQGIELAWVQVDAKDGSGGKEGVAKALQNAGMVIIDTPRNDDQNLVENIAGDAIRKLTVPVVQISRMSRPNRLKTVNVSEEIGRQVFGYYLSGMGVNHRLLFEYTQALMAGGDLDSVPLPVEKPNGGIYHPDYSKEIFADLPSYLKWWQARTGKDGTQGIVLAMETSSSYIGDGQTRHLDALIKDIEQRGAMPLFFYRASRLTQSFFKSQQSVEREQLAAARPEMTGKPSGRQDSSGKPSGKPEAATSGRPSGRPENASGKPPAMRWGAEAQPSSDSNPFPNPKTGRPYKFNEPLITYQGKVLPNVMMVNTFLGGDVEGRKLRYQAQGIPVLNILHYREGGREVYLQDLAGVSSFRLPFTLTNAEYIGIQDPVVLTVNPDGEMLPLPEQQELLVGKMMNLAKLQRKANQDKKLALLFWNHPPGEKNQGASNMNVPRSIEKLVKDLKAQGYALEDISEQEMIDAVGVMLRPAYRKSEVANLMKTDHWAFMPLEKYRQWFTTFPEKVQQEVNEGWGKPEDSQWFVEYQGQKGFVIPRVKLGNLVVMPQPGRGGGSAEEDKDLFHDTNRPMNHYYIATYQWIREQYAADAIIHFGTHGTQEWHPGKERGMWAYDSPNLAVWNTPIIYPYIVDNIGEALHVKRRGRGVIISYQVPPFSPAGLSDDFVAINDAIREYISLDEGLVKSNAKDLIIEQAVKMKIPEDMAWKVEDLHANFDNFLRDIEDYLEDLGSAMQPLGLHTFGESAELDHLALNIMLMLGDDLMKPLGVENSRQLFRTDYKLLKDTAPFKFVRTHIIDNQPLNTSDSANFELVAVVKQGIKYAQNLRAESETKGILSGLSAKWVDPSYGGDPIRNPDAIPTGRNMYGFDPSRIPTKSAYAAGVQAMKELILSHEATHNEFPKKLTFSMWSTETLRHLGMLEAQVFYAMGVKPIWDKGGRVTGLEVIPLKELGRPRIDTVISLTGLYRDQFPNVMERFNEAIVMLANLDEDPEQNLIRANTLRIEKALLAEGVEPKAAKNFALTRVFGTESGDYGTKLPDATLASDKWEETDGKLAELYLSRMSWAYGPDTSQWSQKLTTKDGKPVNVYAEQLKGTSAAVFSRSSNLRGLLDTDHPFEYLGGISLALQHLEGEAPQLYISNMRDPKKAKLQTAERFLATELRAVYQHPNWVKEMQKEGYAGTLQMLNTINNFWGWQVMDRNVVRDDQWQEFHNVYIKDKYELDMKEWFEKSNPTAMAQIAERMLEAIRKDYWKASEETKKELVQVYQELAEKYDVHTDNQTFKAYVAELAAGYGLSSAPAPDMATSAAEPTPAESMEKPESENSEQTEQTKELETVQGQVMQEQQPEEQEPIDQPKWWLLLVALLAAGGVRQIYLRR